jgi:hypothetical protein
MLQGFVRSRLTGAAGTRPLILAPEKRRKLYLAEPAELSGDRVADASCSGANPTGALRPSSISHSLRTNVEDPTVAATMRSLAAEVEGYFYKRSRALVFLNVARN